MDLSSEMIHSLLPLFLVSLGAGAFTLGIIEGIAEGTASISKVFSGTLSDQFARRKPLVVLGYGLAAASKPLFPLADSAIWVFFARFADRIGKGIRGAPRDALLADATPQEIRGAAYGLRQSLDTAGALVGPLAAVALMQLLTNNIRAVFWIATVPAVVAVAVLVFGVKEPTRHVDARPLNAFPRRRDLEQLGSAFWIVVVIGAIFTLARFSEAFLVLLANERGMSLALAPLAMAAMNFTYVLSAYPAGRVSDRIGRPGLLMIGLAILIAADVVLAVGQNLTLVFIGVALWGLHMGLTQGLLAAMVADTAPAELRGSAFGLFHFVNGAAAIAASLLAGGLWQWYGPTLTFLAGAIFSAVALGGLLTWRSRFMTDTR
ncbi:MAG: MFS transporter [Gemmataceae bacterium]|nr:MFS transporter [Gemmataceae bacterium]